MLAYPLCVYLFRYRFDFDAESVPGIREVHMSDLIRAHEGNAESNTDYPNKIHWGKFNMIGKFIHSTTLCQVQCRGTPDYSFKENSHIRKLMQQRVMDVEVWAFLIFEMGCANKCHRCKSRALLPHLMNLSRNPIGLSCLERILAMSRALVNPGILLLLQVFEDFFHGNRPVVCIYPVSEHKCCITDPFIHIFRIPTLMHSFHMSI